MGRAKTERVYRNFARGLITEASGLSYPENALSDVLNMELTKDGYIVKRRGANFEADYSLVAGPATYTDDNILTYLWRAATDDGDDYAVVGVESTLYVFNLSSGTPSANLVTTYSLPFSCGKATCASTGQSLVVTAEGHLPVVITDDAVSTIELQIRDMKDASTDDVDYRAPSTAALTKDLEYDLANRGWRTYRTAVATDDSGSVWVMEDNGLQGVRGVLGHYPSKSDLPQIVQNRFPILPAALLRISPRVGSAPVGHFIVNAHTHSREDLSDKYRSTKTTGTVTPGHEGSIYPSCCAGYAGRIFFAGFGGESTNVVMYSQLVLNDPEKIPRCYQENDPTDPEMSDLLATDGGVLPIEGCGKILQLATAGNSLVVFATNGVWAISGGDRSFSPTNTLVTKLSSDGVVGRTSAVEVAGGLLYMAKAGIYLISQDPAIGVLSARNISEGTIQSFYVEQFPGAAKAYAKGAYDPYNQKVYWFYKKAATYTATTALWEYNAALVLDLRLTAFYPIEFADGVSVIGAFSGPASSTTSYTENVTNNALETLTTTGLEAITITSSYYGASFSGLKMATLHYDEVASEYKLSFAEFNDRNMVDWRLLDNVGASYENYAEVGDDIVGDPSRMKDALTMVAWFEITEDAVEDIGGGDLDFAHKSSCNLKAKWEWTDDSAANRWHDVGEIYELPVTYTPSGVETEDEFSYGYTIASVHRGILGSGRAVRLRFTGSSGKDMRLLGYSLVLTVEEHV